VVPFYFNIFELNTILYKIIFKIMNWFRKVIQNFSYEHYNIGQWLHKHFEDFTKPFVLTLGFTGIICAMIGHYGTLGFNWKWFVFFELPLYLFCSWALYKAYKLYKISKKL